MDKSCLNIASAHRVLTGFRQSGPEIFLLLLYEVFTMIADLPDDFFSVLADEITGTQTETERQEGVSDQADNEADRSLRPQRR